MKKSSKTQKLSSISVLAQLSVNFAGASSVPVPKIERQISISTDDSQIMDSILEGIENFTKLAGHVLSEIL